MLVGRHPTPVQLGRAPALPAAPRYALDMLRIYCVSGRICLPKPQIWGPGIQILGVRDPDLQIQGSEIRPPSGSEDATLRIYTFARARGPDCLGFWGPKWGPNTLFLGPLPYQEGTFALQNGPKSLGNQHFWQVQNHRFSEFSIKTGPETFQKS